MIARPIKMPKIQPTEILKWKLDATCMGLDTVIYTLIYLDILSVAATKLKRNRFLIYSVHVAEFYSVPNP